MGIAGKRDPPALVRQPPQQKRRRIGRRAVSPADGPGVDLKNASPARQLIQRRKGRLPVHRVALIKLGHVLVELGDQVKMPHDLPAGHGVHPGHPLIVIPGQGVPVPAEPALYPACQGGRALVQRQLRPVRHEQTVHRPYLVVPVRAGVRRIKILFQAQIYLHPPGVFGFQLHHRPAVVGHPGRVHSPGLLPRQRRMARKPNRPASRRKSRGRHGGGAVRPIAEGGVAVQGLGFHTIFSCFTLWSITWRLASSASTSSTEMPISTISTIT